MSTLHIASACPVLDPFPDPPNNALPGYYYEHKAEIYFEKHDARSALQMYLLAAYWGNKISQYNLGILYFQGSDAVLQDKPLGTAWLRLSAQSIGPRGKAALERAYSLLTPEERVRTDLLFEQMKPQYGNTATFRRAKNRYDSERRNVTGSHVGFVGNIVVCLPDGSSVNGSRYYTQMDKQFAIYIDSNFGHVEVEPIISVPDIDREK